MDNRKNQEPSLTDLQIAVSKAMGWKQVGKLNPAWINPKTGESLNDPPALTLDLMFQAEEMLVGDERWKYAEMMVEMGTWFDAVHATAEQKAKIWMKIKGIQ